MFTSGKSLKVKKSNIGNIKATSHDKTRQRSLISKRSTKSCERGKDEMSSVNFSLWGAGNMLVHPSECPRTTGLSHKKYKKRQSERYAYTFSASPTLLARGSQSLTTDIIGRQLLERKVLPMGELLLLLFVLFELFLSRMLVMLSLIFGPFCVSFGLVTWMMNPRIGRGEMVVTADDNIKIVSSYFVVAEVIVVIVAAVALELSGAWCDVLLHCWLIIVIVLKFISFFLVLSIQKTFASLNERLRWRGQRVGSQERGKNSWLTPELSLLVDVSARSQPHPFVVGRFHVGSLGFVATCNGRGSPTRSGTEPRSRCCSTCGGTGSWGVF